LDTESSNLSLSSSAQTIDLAFLPPVSALLSEPTVREPDGLAMSSRNARLSDEQRRQAPKLHQTLKKIAEVVRLGGGGFRKLESKGVEMLQKVGFVVDYVEICRVLDLRPASPGEQDLIVLAAAWLGDTRLIDNLSV
jgi:pantoate--beta-alanine ligase